VIGAGVAGLAAAAELGRAAGVQSLLLEGRDRIGGRIFTRRDPVSNAPIELGAEFVHGRPPEIWNLLTQSGMQPDEMTGEDWCFRNSELCACDFFSRVDKVLEKLDDTGPDESFSDFLKRCGPDCADEDTKRWALGYITGFHAADPELISVHSLVKGIRADEQIDGERAFRIPQGYEFLVELLRKDLPQMSSIQLNSVVEAIEWRPGHAAVQFRQENGSTRLQAPQVLITVPLGVLQATEGEGVIRFTPELPDSKRNALEHLAMGSALRVSLRFRERFWDGLRSPNDPQGTLSDLRFLFSQESWFPTWWTTLPRKLPIITGWAPASQAVQLSREGDWSVVGTAIHALGNLLRVPEKQLENLLEGALWHDWQSDPFSRGAYSYVKKNGVTAQRELGAPLENTLFFAGEATDVSGYTGTVHGAIASGRRAAQEIVRGLQ
jgi:monoamine oxidase